MYAQAAVETDAQGVGGQLGKEPIRATLSGCRRRHNYVYGRAPGDAAHTVPDLVGTVGAPALDATRERLRTDRSLTSRPFRAAGYGAGVQGAGCDCVCTAIQTHYIYREKLGCVPNCRRAIP